MDIKRLLSNFYFRLPRLILRGIIHSRTEFLFFVLMANVLAWTGNRCGALTDPFLSFLSPHFQLIHDDITQQVQASLQKPFFSSDISNLMLYLGGIHCADYKDTKNLLSPHYDIHRKRILRNQIDYDELMKSSAYATSRH